MKSSQGQTPFLSDIEIAQANKLLPIKAIAKKFHLKENDLELYGKYKGKNIFQMMKNTNSHLKPFRK